MLVSMGTVSMVTNGGHFFPTMATVFAVARTARTWLFMSNLFRSTNNVKLYVYHVLLINLFSLRQQLPHTSSIKKITKISCTELSQKVKMESNNKEENRNITITATSTGWVCISLRHDDDDEDSIGDNDNVVDNNCCLYYYNYLGMCWTHVLNLSTAKDRPIPRHFGSSRIVMVC